MNAARPPNCRYSGRMSGVLGQQLGRKYSRPGPLRELGEVLGQLLLGVAPGEVRVRLGEAELRQPVHHLRPRERLGEEDHVRVRRAGSRSITHSQNGNGLVCGLSTRKMRTPSSSQNSNTLASSSHSPFQSSRLEVERIDVLVLLGRVLGVLDGAVGPLAEPLGMLAHVGVVGRALERDVQRDLEPELAGARPRAAGSRRACRARGCIALWPPSAAPIAHGLPTSSGSATSVLFGPLRRSRPIGWIGGR